MNRHTNPHRGSKFDDFLREEGIYDEVEAAALKKVIAVTLGETMRRKGLSVARLAAQLGTSRTVINRILDEQNTSITLRTLTRAASALGCRITLEIVAV